MKRKLFPKKPPPIHLTQQSLNTAHKKLGELTVYRAQVLVRLQTAREMGDLSENGAYTAARFELSDTDRKLRHYHKLIRFGVVPTKSSSGTVSFGSLVTLNTSNKEISYTLVGSFEADPTKGTLSVDSPLGKLLLGKRAGDTIVLTTPTGDKTFHISAVD